MPWIVLVQVDSSALRRIFVEYAFRRRIRPYRRRVVRQLRRIRFIECTVLSESKLILYSLNIVAVPFGYNRVQLLLYSV